MNQKEIKKILLISYHFPPSTEVGGLRIAHFARYLPEFGWQTTVLTVKDEYIEKRDRQKQGELESMKIYKAGRLPTTSDLYLGIKKRLGGWVRKRSASDARAKADSRLPRGLDPGPETVGQKLRRYLLSFMTLPDPYRNWTLPALIAAVRLIRRERIDCILTSCPPYSVHLVGLMAKWLTGVRWVADFRDPWMTACSKALYFTCDASLGVERWMERSVVKNADLVAANTERLYEAFRKAYPSLPADRFACITNGYDGRLFSKIMHLDKEKVFTIIYTGTLYFGRTPEPVFRAVQELIQEGRIQLESIRFRLVGHCRSVEGRSIDEVISQYHLKEVVEVLDPVPYVRAIEMIRQSHLALLLAPNQPYQIPAKAYDYMGIGTKILAIAEEGATADLIRSTGVGGAFSPSDIEGIKKFVLQVSHEKDRSRDGAELEAAARFDVTELTRQLAARLDRICVRLG